MNRHRRDQIGLTGLIGAGGHRRLPRVICFQLPIATITAEQECHTCTSCSSIFGRLYAAGCTRGAPWQVTPSTRIIPKPAEEGTAGCPPYSFSTQGRCQNDSALYGLKGRMRHLTNDAEQHSISATRHLNLPQGDASGVRFYLLCA